MSSSNDVERLPGIYITDHDACAVILDGLVKNIGSVTGIYMSEDRKYARIDFDNEQSA